MKFYNIENIYEELTPKNYKGADRNIAIALHDAIKEYIDEMQNVEYAISHWDNPKNKLPSHIKEQGVEHFLEVFYMVNLKRFFAMLEGVKSLHYKYVQDIELEKLLNNLLQDINEEIHKVKLLNKGRGIDYDFYEEIKNIEEIIDCIETENREYAYQVEPYMLELPSLLKELIGLKSEMNKKEII